MDFQHTDDELRLYLEMAEDSSPEVGENPRLALEWWKVAYFNVCVNLTNKMTDDVNLRS